MRYVAETGVAAPAWARGSRSNTTRPPGCTVSSSSSSRKVGFTFEAPAATPVTDEADTLDEVRRCVAPEANARPAKRPLRLPVFSYVCTPSDGRAFRVQNEAIQKN